MGRMIGSVSYSSRVALVACPFCREMFQEGEAKQCPLCGVELAAFEKLPPSIDALHDEDGTPRDPLAEPLPPTYLGRGKGLIAACAAIGLALFFLPWLHMTLPNVDTYTGFEVSKKLGWTFAAGVSWFVLIPTVLSRRSILQMRGARLAATFLAAIPTMTAAILLFHPPTGSPRVPLRFSYDWPIYVTLALGAACVIASLRFGGRADVIKLKRGTSAGQTLH
jgi:hypothetical protein